MKKITICYKYHKHITDEDYGVLKLISPGLARNVTISDYESPTHFVCAKCGQVAPVKIRTLHTCDDMDISGDRRVSPLRTQ